MAKASPDSAPTPGARALRAAPRRRAPRATFKPPSRARVRRVRERLRDIYGIPAVAPHGDALAELILTVLSQSTNDRNRDVAYLALRERFGGWREVRDAPLAAVELAIRPGGISKVKSARIQAILRAISASQPREDAAEPTGGDSGGPGRRGSGELSREGHGEVSLDWLAQTPTGQARDYLTALPGVGRKTAACVLLFALGRREVPVDTHVSRVGIRLGLLAAGASFDELHDQMLALTPPGQELELHVNLLRHGRRTCFARNPACPACALARMCPSRGLGNAGQPRGSTAKAITA